jgi:GDYXXLXY protein
MTFARASLTLLAIQLALVSSIAAKYLAQRSTSPHVWTRAVAYDPEMVLRGRYLSTQLTVDACGVKLPIAPANTQSSPQNTLYFADDKGLITMTLPVMIASEKDKLVVKRIASREEHASQEIALRKGSSCGDAILWNPVDFYLPEKANSPLPLALDQQLWVEVTVPPTGPPRPLRLAIKTNDGKWQPLTLAN